MDSLTTIDIHIKPRSSGKTHNALKSLMHSTPPSLLMVKDYNAKREIEKIITDKYKGRTSVCSNVITSHSVLEGKAPAILILDDYFLFDTEKKKEIYKWAKNITWINQVIIYSTSDKLYNISNLKAAKQIKEEKIKPLRFHKKQLEDLYYNFLTEPAAIIHANSPTIIMDKKQILNLPASQHILTELAGAYAYE